jgi:hypothetical protein
MDNDKSILEKLTETVKDIASIAADAAGHALSAEQPALKADGQAVAYMPLAADGFVSDPMMIAPIAPARKKRAAAKPPAKKAGKRTAKRAVKKPARKTAKKSAAKRARKTAKKSPKKANKKSAGKTTKKAARKTRRAR